MNSTRCFGVTCFAFCTVFALGAAAQSPSEVLEKLKASDSIFQAGGSISGSQIRVDDHSLVGRRSHGILKVRQNWKQAFEPGRTGYLIEMVDHEKPAYKRPQPPALDDPRIRFSEEEIAQFNKGLMHYQIRSKEWGYWGDDVSGRHQVDMAMTISPENETAVIGTMHNSSLHSPNSMDFNRFKHTFLWSLGRFYSTLIYEVSSVERLPDGRLRVSAVGIKDGTEPGRWDLVIEPDAAWMVREARFYRDARPDKIRFEMVNNGTTWSGAYCIPEEAVCNYFGQIDEDSNLDVELIFDPVVEEFDKELYAAAKQAVTTDRPPKLTIHDYRVSPTLIYQPDEALR